MKTRGLTNVFIQKIGDSGKYLITVNRNTRIEKAEILTKDELIVWLKKRLSSD